MVARMIALLLAVALLASGCSPSDPEENYTAVVSGFMDALAVKDFDAMYNLLTSESMRDTSKEVFKNRYNNIYGSVEAKNIAVTPGKTEPMDGGGRRVHFTMSMDTVAGGLSVENYVDVIKNQSGEYRMHWDPHVIFPGLSAERPVRVDKTKAKTGEIYDRDGRLLAGSGDIKAVGIVVEKLREETREEDLNRIAELLSISTEALNEKIHASWVREGFVVPVAELDAQDTETKDQLLQIPGIRIDDKTGRIYPYGKEISQEDKYIDRLKGIDGRRIVITNAGGEVLYILKDQPAVDGETITLDISVEE